MKPALCAVVVSALVMGCPKSEITMIGQAKPELPRDCPVTVFPTTTPNYPSRDIATVKTDCQSYRRTVCIEQLKKDACKLGGDTVYALLERKDPTLPILVVSATIAHSSEGAVPPSGSGASQLAAETCRPPCSPGYICHGTMCVALCNPACAAGMHCASDRTCQPDNPDAGP